MADPVVDPPELSDFDHHKSHLNGGIGGRGPSAFVSHPVRNVRRVPHPTTPDALLAGLNADQRRAVTTDDGPLRILAGAGSGKTRVLTRRIAHRVLTGTADAPHVLALTFTRKAAGELRERLRGLGVRPAVVAGTFHAVAYAQLRRRWADRGESAPALLDRKSRLLVPLLGPSESARLLAADAASEIEWAKARLVSPERYGAEAERVGRTPPLPFEEMATLYLRYEAEKRKRRVVDFDDLLGRCAAALADDEEFAASQRWRFRHLFVDEFQDVNPVQFHLLRGWLGDRLDLCVVGDPNQAIYSWNGADPDLLVDFASHFPTASTIRLDDNYRSSPQVLAVASAVLAGQEESPAPIQAHQADGRLPTVRSMPDAAAEATTIAAEIRRHHGPTRPWSDCAVLVRTNAQSVEFERAFRAAQIPFRVRGGGGLLRQPEVTAALADLAASPARVPFASRLADLESGLLGLTDPDRRDHLAALVRLGHEYALLDARPSVPAFQAWLVATVQGDEPEAGADAVEVVTFHRSKGLEWPIVFIAGLERGLVPIGRAESEGELAEERRLLYVAMTRARDELHCSWSERRTFGERSMRRSPSPWLETVEAALHRLGGGTAVTWRPALDRQRTRLRSLGPALDPEHEAVLTALKQWRSRTAKAAAIPPHLVFADVTLAALAAGVPTTAPRCSASPASVRSRSSDTAMPSSPSSLTNARAPDRR